MTTISNLMALVTAATSGTETAKSADRATGRLLDAAVLEAAHVGLARITVEDVVRRAGVSRMTAYRRYPRRDDLVAALVQRETDRFLAAVADGIAAATDPRARVTEAFIAAVRFSRIHPMLRRAGQTGSSLSADDTAMLLEAGSAFVATQIAGAGNQPSQQVRWVADVCARLILTYISAPPTDPDFGDDAELRRFAEEILTPMVARATTP
ncbi:TetR/AcrR family transcriptional regulator [Mycolicibacterium komossense]|uniref:TetR/AcrR family transcriptional regulator n=1 Tax=Mycolicibacterium komossense TaxID=1779 RepID=A0ABT3CIM3_9MYCO|nr:TetR/AcrR family transcriptional regulator [Mycolicibacterium komossense]MCV7229328.1 TetR/AcrR family transcriptional regulator [Mycolicibacterium komossense]